MKHTIIGIFDNVRSAQRAAAMLQDGGFSLDDLSIVSRDADKSLGVQSADDVSSGEGAALGAVWGGIVGLGALLIPGIGPIIAGGALASALTGAAVGGVAGAAVGGVAAALIHVGGISEAEAKEYEALVHSGKTLVAARVNPEDSRHVHRIFSKAGAESVEGDSSLPSAPVTQVSTESASSVPSAPAVQVTTETTSDAPSVPAVQVTTYDADGRRVEHAPE